MSRLWRVVLSLALLAIVVSLADWKSVAHVLTRVDPAWAAAAVALALADRLILNYRWHKLLRARGVRLGFGRLFRVQLAANFLGSFLPTSVGVDAVRMTALCRAGEPAGPVIGATLVDRATIVLATLLLGSVTILPLAGTHISAELQQAVVIATLIAVGMSGLLLLPSVRRLARAALAARLSKQVTDKLAAIASAALAYRREGGLIARIGLLTIALFVVRIVFVKALLLACGTDVAFSALLLTIPILWILLMLPITVGGLGVQDAGYVGLLGLIGVSPAVAVSVSLLEHLSSRLISMPGAFLIAFSRAPGRQDEAVNATVTRRGPEVHRRPGLRMLTDSSYRARAIRYALGLPNQLRTTDREVLEKVIFSHYAALETVRSVLFVGCDWYTQHYERMYFRKKDYWTIDPAARARRFGARQHLVASLEALDEHCPPGYFDLIICNGVFGYGLDSRAACERAFNACQRALREGGHLILGWDDVPERTPVPLDELASLARFGRLPFAPLGTWRYRTDTPYCHTYDFYCAGAGGARSGA